MFGFVWTEERVQQTFCQDRLRRFVRTDLPDVLSGSRVVMGWKCLVLGGYWWSQVVTGGNGLVTLGFGWLIVVWVVTVGYWWLCGGNGL